jgi:hypothetical protein
MPASAAKAVLEINGRFAGLATEYFHAIGTDVEIENLKNLQ